MKLINFYLLFLFICYTRSYTVTDRIDFERECDKQMQVFDYSIIEVFAFPGIGNSEISQCKAKFVASPADRKLRIYIQEFKLEGLTCGHQMNIYDNTEFLNKPTWTLGCNSPLTTYTTSSNNAILSFTKPTVDSSQGYRFKILITTDREESTLSFKPFKLTSNRLFEALKLPDYHNLHHRNRRDDTPSYTAPLTGDASGTGSGGISSGAIAGIAIGCVVGAVIIIAICIYALWKYMRKTEEKKRYGANEPPPVFVTSEAPLSNCGIAPGSSRRSFRTRSHVAFSDISKKSDENSLNSHGLSKSKSNKSYDNHGFSNDGTSVSSSTTKDENSKSTKSSSGISYKNDDNKNEFRRNVNDKGSLRKNRNEEKINYPDVVNSARTSERERRKTDKDNEHMNPRETTSRCDSVKQSDNLTVRKDRSESLKRNDRDKHRIRPDDREGDSDMAKKYSSQGTNHREGRERKRNVERQERTRYDRDSNQNDRQRTRGYKYKTESVNTDDSGATYPSSISDRYDRYNRRDRNENRYVDRKYRDDRHDDHRRNNKLSERSSSQRRGRTDSSRRYPTNIEERGNEVRRSGREGSGRSRSHSTSRIRSSHHDQHSGNDRYRDSYNHRSDREDERDFGLRRRDSSRSHGGRHRSRSSFR